MDQLVLDHSERKGNLLMLWSVHFSVLNYRVSLICNISQIG